MTTPTSPTRTLRSFKLLSFDIYGTLIDWEASITGLLDPLTSRLPEGHPLKHDTLELGRLFEKTERQLQSEQPTLRYDRLLSEGYIKLARDYMQVEGLSDAELKSQAEAFGASVPQWKHFPDTIAAMQRLKKYYRLVPLSNVDKASFKKTVEGPLKGVVFDAIYTAEDIGSYKPDMRNFEYLIKHVKEDFGIEKDEILHTAQSLFHDHVPAKKMGLNSAWINRGKDGVAAMGGNVKELVGSGKVGFGWRFGSLGEMAEAVEKE